jgi:hypothetical protein
MNTLAFDSVQDIVEGRVVDSATDYIAAIPGLS